MVLRTISGLPCRWKKSLGISNLSLPSCTKCPPREPQYVSLKLAGSQRLIRVAQGKSEHLLVVVLGGLDCQCNQLLEIQGQQMQITQDPDTYPVLLQFLPEQEEEAGLGQIACGVGELTRLNSRLLRAFLRVSGTVLGAVPLHPLNDSDRRSPGSPFSSRKLRLGQESQIETAQGQTTIKCGIRIGSVWGAREAGSVKRLTLFRLRS